MTVTAGTLRPFKTLCGSPLLAGERDQTKVRL